MDEISEYLGVVRGGEVGPLDGLQLGHGELVLVVSYPDHSVNTQVNVRTRAGTDLW